MTITEAQRKAQKRYYDKNKANTRCVMLRFRRDADADVLAKLDEVPSKIDYIRALVRKSMRNGE